MPAPRLHLFAERLASFSLDEVGSALLARLIVRAQQVHETLVHPLFAVDNTAVRESQIKRLKELRANRDEAAVKKALEAITECVKTGKGNLLELAIEAAKVRASLGEISDACEVVVGRYKAVIRSISGVYSSEVKSDPAFEHAKELVPNSRRRRAASRAS